MDYPEHARRPRRWPIFAPLGFVLVLAVLWTGGWFYASSLARTQLDGWREREAKAGHFYTCGDESVGGFPFRFEVRCTDPSAELRSEQPPVALRAADILAVAQIYQPTLLITEITGPLTIAAPGQAPAFIANWKLAQSSLRGTPVAPERVSIAVDDPVIDRVSGTDKVTVLKAEHIELHGRIAEGTVAENPVLDIVLQMTAATAPELHPLTTKPLDADVAAVLRGLQDFAPKPWPVRFKELQAHGGTIEITKARLQQGDVIAVGAGTLALSARGALDGQLYVTVVGLEKLLKDLDLERLMSQGDIGATINSLDRLMPGLGAIARKNAPSLIASFGGMGQNATLEGKPAVTVPLRFTDGAVMLGPFQVGRVPPVF